MVFEDQHAGYGLSGRSKMPAFGYTDMGSSAHVWEDFPLPFLSAYLGKTIKIRSVKKLTESPTCLLTESFVLSYVFHNGPLFATSTSSSLQCPVFVPES